MDILSLRSVNLDQSIKVKESSLDISQLGEIVRVQYEGTWNKKIEVMN